MDDKGCRKTPSLRVQTAPELEDAGIWRLKKNLLPFCTLLPQKRKPDLLSSLENSILQCANELFDSEGSVILETFISNVGKSLKTNNQQHVASSFHSLLQYMGTGVCLNDTPELPKGLSWLKPIFSESHTRCGANTSPSLPADWSYWTGCSSLNHNKKKRK